MCMRACVCMCVCMECMDSDPTFLPRIIKGLSYLILKVCHGAAVLTCRSAHCTPGSAVVTCRSAFWTPGGAVLQVELELYLTLVRH